MRRSQNKHYYCLGTKRCRPCKVESSEGTCISFPTDQRNTWIRIRGEEAENCDCLQGAPFPPCFREVVKTIFNRMFRVYAHIYHSHFQKIVHLKEEALLNTCFKHFILFSRGIVYLGLRSLGIYSKGPTSEYLWTAEVVNVGYDRIGSWN
ncbi:hypothetical protein MRB53_013900 [Persea americana]|uniref:Uncharacterized protein n=1 Tax=Persea americana TaxID=3435 RepID=A0ACC2K9S9_PERAE|nr:hypothetical protein MRB53_013900 [Persea americana]